MDASIVVLTWEDVDRTRACVRSLPAGCEIVVVDNGSSPSIREAVAELCAGTGSTYVQAGTNLGYAKGMNLGVRHSTRASVILANNDVLVREGTVGRLLAALDDPDVGAAFPRVVDEHGTDRTEAGRFLTLRVGVAHATGIGALVPRLRITARPARADWFTGPFVAMRRHILDLIGGVDETSFFYGEDLRLCWSVRRLGRRIAYVPDAVIHHETDGTSKRRWSAEERARRQTREFIRASRELGGWQGRAGSAAYVGGALARAAIGGGTLRRAVARGAVEGMRAG